MHNATKTVATLLALVAGAACGGSSSTGSTGSGGSVTASSSSTSTSTSTSGGPTAMQACADSAHASCTKRDSCTNGFLNEYTYGSEMECEMRAALTCVTALAAKGTGQTPTNVEHCVSAYPGYSCTDYFDSNPSAACIPPVGTLANGAACGANAQCTSTFCAIGPFATCGTCKPLPAAGATCLAQSDCGRNLACAKPSSATDLTMGTCAAWVASGGACLTGTAPCESGLACVGDDETTKTMGKCAAQPTTVGAACDRSRKTMPNCAEGLVCVPSMKGTEVGTCQAITLVAGGATCGDIGSAPITGVAVCEAGGLCVKAAPTDTTGTCVAPAADGMPCDADPTKGPPCLSPAKCVPTTQGMTAGTCTVPDATKCM